MDRETFAWALVFSVPPGVGIAGFAAFVIGRGEFDPMAILAGFGTTLVIFVIVAYAFSVGSADEDREGGGHT